MNKKQHTSSKRAHQELTAMEHLDTDIEKIFEEKEVAFSDRLYNLFSNNGYNNLYLREKMHIIVNQLIT